MNQKKSNNLIIDSFEAPSNLKWQLDEFANSDKVVDGQYILGRVVGPMFQPNGDSLNGRHYTRGLWELALERNQDRLQHGDVLGTLGHDQALDDNALAEGKISHKVVKMWIDEKTGAGMGEIHILGTESGKQLNALLRGGIGLQVSTRATGEITNRKSSTGQPIIDEDSYSFQGIDFVRRGGIPSARPVLVENSNGETLSVLTNIESTEKLIEPTNSPLKEEYKMSEKLLETLAIDKGKLQDSLTEALNHNKNLTTERDALRLEVDNRQKEVNRTADALEESKKKITDLEGKLADAGSSTKKYETLGDPAKVTEELTSLRALVAQYEEFGTPAQLTEAYAKVDKLVEEYAPLGSPEHVSGLLAEAERFAELGDFDEVSAKLENLEKYEEFSSIEDLPLLSEAMDSYKKLGTPEEIEKAFCATDDQLNKFKATSIKNEAAEISKKYKVKAEKVEEMLSKNGKELTISILDDLVSDRSSIEERYTVPANTPSNKSLNEANSYVPRSEKTRGDWLMERFSKVTPVTSNRFDQTNFNE